MQSISNFIKDTIEEQFGIERYNLDQAVENINVSEKNLTDQEIFNVSQDFNNNIDINRLDKDEMKLLTQDIIDNVADQRLKFNMLEILNSKTRKHILEPIIKKGRVGIKVSFDDKDIITLPKKQKSIISFDSIDKELKNKSLKIDTHPHITNQSTNGFFIHNPKKITYFGDIKILEDEDKIKEIILHKNIDINDLTKLVHSIFKDNGVMLDQKGNLIIKIDNNVDIQSIMFQILKHIKKQTNNTIRLLFKSKSPVGGLFTNIIGHTLYNKPTHNYKVIGI